MDKNKIKVAVGLSGGVDSSVAAFLLKKEGFEVIGYYMKNWSMDIGKFKCPWKEDQEYALRVADHLDIPVYTLNFEKEYKEKVVDYLFESYEKGITPNPDIMCNKEIKFKMFLERATKIGADYIATGHYAINKRDKNGTCHLLKAKDNNKDQSYFLHELTQYQLSKTLFPVGKYSKPEIREIAKKAKLPTANKPDSQGICFIGEVSIVDLLKTRIKPKIGDIVTTNGKKIGEHDGVWFYTLGQRKGIGIGGGVPYFVVDKDLKNNKLIVDSGSWSEDLFSNACLVKEVNWITKEPELGLKYNVKLRYRQEDQECVIKKEKNKLYKLEFTNPQRAVTPGQFAVFYDKDECLGGGVIVG